MDCAKQSLEENNIAKKGFLNNLYDRLLKVSDTKKAKKVMYAVSFAESSFFPLPPDLMLIPMILADRTKAWSLAFYSTIFSVLGGVLGYAIGYFLFASLGEWIINTYNMQSAFLKFQQDFQQYGFWIIALKGLTPIPFKLVTIASGLVRFDFLTFILASIVARAFRFYLLSALLWRFGEFAKQFIEKYLTIALLGSLFIIVLGFVILKFI